MTNLKRVMISLPDNLLEEVDGVVQEKNQNRSEFIREAMKLYITELRKKEIKREMKQGYLEMGNINLELAEDNINTENRDFFKYETNIAECE
ncbi:MULTISPECIES: CopG family ribbon-helix-helix protein [unclassified Candidatus Frackibacter]|uniref:CopG family ribbon-helix-helix protein n=1 Tax=unclassified Candidatus Frackibacter TaxID=2648818 RepID=UPI0008903E1E|nr:MULTISPECIES: ribbon-helix-helix protein, CopG family [unclassified Candidatus Frackibacter]SDC23505.1 transcriptional regulator, CopG family [Candidatus Frackibacter sp. WG11]SEM48451.1 transcriptional regulator, CopG family [Candidatus Frackibacter sp. WG12]SFL50296.1 transcriptional regulator, CopG family [Candidatus Frackibacter sp. WG13]